MSLLCEEIAASDENSAGTGQDKFFAYDGGRTNRPRDHASKTNAYRANDRILRPFTCSQSEIPYAD